MSGQHESIYLIIQRSQYKFHLSPIELKKKKRKDQSNFHLSNSRLFEKNAAPSDQKVAVIISVLD